jgi:heme a synthase
MRHATRQTTPSSTAAQPAPGPTGARAAFERVFSRQFFKILSVVTTIGMFIVLVMGVTVTTTNSARGCGGSWPLCNGKFIPEFAVSTLIEFSHRAVTGVETILVLALAAGVLYYWRGRREIQILAPLMVIFLFLQAALGALAVVFNPTPPEILAAHFGVSLLSFVSILLVAIFLFEEKTTDRLRDRPTPAGFRNLVFALALYTYFVVYTGAYVRHRGVELACATWPLCNGQVVPNLTSGAGIVFLHRFASLLLAAGAVWLFLWARRLRAGRPDLYWGSVAVLVGVILQALEGALVVWSRLNLFSLLAHGAVIALVFGALGYLVIHVLPRQRNIRSLVKPAAKVNVSATSAQTATSPQG